MQEYRKGSFKKTV